MDDLDEFALIKSYASILQVLLYRSYKLICYHSQKNKNKNDMSSITRSNSILIYSFVEVSLIATSICNIFEVTFVFSPKQNYELTEIKPNHH